MPTDQILAYLLQNVKSWIGQLKPSAILAANAAAVHLEEEGHRRLRRPMPTSQPFLTVAASIDQYPGSPQATAERRWPEGYCRRRSEAVGGDQGRQGAVTVCKKKEAEGRLSCIQKLACFKAISERPPLNGQFPEPVYRQQPASA